MPERKPEDTCFGCLHITYKRYADGTTLYGCYLCPGLVKGESSPFCYDDDPKRCEKYEKTRSYRRDFR